MDTNRSIQIAESKGLEAINLIRNSRATITAKPEPQMTRLTPRPEQVMSVRPTGPQMTRLTPRPEQVMSRVSIVYKQPSVKPISFPLYESLASIKIQPVVSASKPQIEFDLKKLFAPEEERQERLSYNWNKLTSELGDFFTQKVGPSLVDYIKSSVSAGVPAGFGGNMAMPGTPGFAEAGARNIAIATRPEQAAQIRGTEAEAGIQSTLFGLQALNLPTEAIIQRSLVQPFFQNWKLDQALKEGVSVTAEQRRAADLGDLNLSWNDILKKQRIEIDNTMSEQEKKIAEKANRDFFWRDVLDTAVSLIDLDTLYGVAKIPKAAKSLALAVRIDNINEIINDISRLAVKGDKAGIEKVIGRKLTGNEVVRVNQIARNPESKNADKVIGEIKSNQIDNEAKDASDFNKELNIARELASGKKKTAIERIKDIWANYKTLFESSNDEFFTLINKIEKQIGEIKPSENPLYFFDAMYKSARQAELFAKTYGFEDILKKAAQLSDSRTPEEFGNFLLIRRELKLKDTIGKKVANEKRARNFLKQYNNKYAELAKDYDAYMNKVITYAQKNNLISTEEYDRLTKLEDYTPFYKIFDMTKKPEPTVFASKRVGGVGGPINQKIKTVEEQTYENPVIASLFYTYKVIDQVNKNNFSSRVGKLVRDGKIEGASIAVDADNVVRRNNLLQDIKELKKVQNRVNNVLTKKKVQWKMVAKELNALAKRGMNISLNLKDEPVDNAFLRRVEKKINDRLQKKQNLLKEIDDLNEAGLDFSYVNLDNEQANRDLEITNKFTEKFTKRITNKQEQIEELTNEINDLNIQGLDVKLSSGQETLSQSGFNTKLRNKIQNKVIKKEELVEDLLDSTDETVKNRLNKYLFNKTGVKYTKKADRLEFYKSLTEDELDDLMYKIYDLNVNEFKKFKDKFKTVARNKKQYDEIISEIDTLKARQATNDLTNSLIKMTPKELNTIYTQISKKNKKIKDLLGDIKDLSDARLTNFLTNKLIKSNPEELNAIKGLIKNKESDLTKVINEVEELSTNRYYNALVTSLIKKTPQQIEDLKPELTFIRKANKRKEAVLENITNTILDAQKIKEETTAGIQTRQAEERLLRNAETAGQSTISWYRNGIKETAIVPKQLADSLTIPNDVGVLDEIVRIATLPTKYWKETIVGGNPVSQARQFYKDQELMMFTTIPRMGFSVANPVVFFKALFGSAVETPEYQKYLALGGGGTSYDVYGGRQTVEEYVKKGGNTSKISWEKWKKLIGKGEETTRYQIYLGAKEFYIRRGYLLEDAEIRAVYDANNNLPNFFRKGKLSKALEAAVPFVSSKIAGAKVVRDLFATNPTAASLYVIGRVAIPMGALTYWNMSSPERAEAYADIPESEKERGPIILPEAPTRNKEGKWDYISPPGDESIMSLSNGFRRGFEALMKSDEKAMFDKFDKFFTDEGIDIPKTGAEILEATTGQEIPLSKRQTEQQASGLNPFLAVPAQGLFNFNLFTGQQIETNEDLRKLPKDRFDDKTTLLAKDLGREYNISPKTVDFYMNNYVTGLLGYARYSLDELRTQFKNDPRDVVGRSMLQDFERIIKRSSGGASEAKIRETLKEEEQVRGSKKLLIEEALKNNDLDIVRNLSSEFTLQEMRAIENRIQTDAVRDNLVGPQRNLFNLSNSELDRVAEKNPEYQSDVDAIKELKKEINRTPNTNFAELGIKFKPSAGGGVSFPKIARVKVGKIAKPKRVRLKAPAKPKKIRVSKPKQIKRPKLAKIKPLKKFKRI